MQKCEFFGQIGIARVAQLGKEFLCEFLGAHKHLPDFADNEFKKFNITLLVGYGPLPIPLIDVSRVVVIEKIILADSPHVSADTFSGTAIELLQGNSFPFRGGLDDLSFDRI